MNIMRQDHPTKYTISTDIKSKIRNIRDTPELEECNITRFQEIKVKIIIILLIFISNFFKIC